MTAPDHRGNVKFLLHRGRRPYMAHSGHLRHCSENVCCRGYSGPIQRRGLTPAFDPLQTLMERANRTAAIDTSV